MKLPCRSIFATALVLALPSFGALAQASSPPTLPDLTAPAASAASTASAASKTGPRLRSPVEAGNRAAAPGDLRPERPVSPQISIPFGKKPAAPTKGEERVVREGNPARNGVDDAAARCEAQADEQLRAACRARLAHESKGKLPN
jgi:hypothetical protein